MKVHILIREYDEDFCHPFNDPVKETQVLNVYVTDEALEIAAMRAKKKYPRSHIYSVSRDIRDINLQREINDERTALSEE